MTDIGPKSRKNGQTKLSGGRTSGTRPKGSGVSAKGGGDRPARPFTRDEPTIVSASDSNSDADAQSYRLKRRADNRERREKAWTALDALVDDADHPSHFNAARETLNRLDGMPAQTAKIEFKRPTEDLSDDELKSAIAALKAQIAISGVGEGDGSEESGEPASGLSALL